MVAGYIDIIGLSTHEELRTDFPSGVFSIPINAELSSVNATFGFNDTPHRFELEYIANNFSSEILPPIGSGVQFTIGDNFIVQGRIVHADYNKSAHGNIISISIEDIRNDLKDIYIDTYGIFGFADTPTQNIVDVRHWYTQNFSFRDVARSRVVKDLRLLDEHGATYRQIYDAIKYFEEQLGTINDIVSKIPEPYIIEKQLPFDPNAYRWQFRSQPLLDVLIRILGDISYDFYWNMKDQKINVINRKFAINIDKNNIPVAGDTAQIVSLRYGNDEAEKATNVRLYGAQMEGLLGDGSLGTQSGAYEIAASGAIGHKLYDLGITPFAKGHTITIAGQNYSSNSLLFVPGWRGAKLKYFGPDGSLRDDYPDDRQLMAALKGIEYWAMEKHLDNRIDAATIKPTSGRTEDQEQFTSSAGLGFIDNRGQPGRSWVLEWYNRVRNFAQNHFGRTFILHPETALYDEIDEFDVLDEAWCNIENLKEGGTFEDNYKIKSEYRFLYPFWNEDNNKMKPFASFVATRRFATHIVNAWGIDGQGVPSQQYGEWNESEKIQYVPIEARKWDQARDAFQEEFLEFRRSLDKGIMIRLPNLLWLAFASNIDTNLNKKPALRAFGEAFTGKTQQDIISNPLAYGLITRAVQNLAIPIRVKRRYGFSWPSPWASGTGTSFDVQIKDELAPWNYEPRGTKQSWMLMEDEAKSSLASLVSFRNSVTFAEVQKLGLPIISFDNFANQGLTTNGYGIISHGVTVLSITKNADWWQTKYSIKSHYPQFVKAKPVTDEIREDFKFAIRRLEKKIPVPTNPFSPPAIFDPETQDNRRSWVTSTKTSLTIPVTITQVLGREQGNEYYVGQDSNSATWPAMFRSGINLSGDSIYFQNRKAFANDGFLQIGMKALYHYEDQEDGSFLHYFTGGVSLSAGRVVELLESPRLVEGVWRANIRTFPDTVKDIEGNNVVIDPFTMYNVPFLNQQSVDTSLASGDKLFAGGTGNDNTLTPGADIGTGKDKDKIHLINSAVPSNIGFATVTTRPSTVTGLGGAVKTISTSGGQTITDGQTIGGVKYNVRFIGAEYDVIAESTPCITLKENEQGADGEVRLYCYILMPLFMPTGAAGG